MPTAKEIASHLEKARPNSDGSFTARCPAHNDRTPSLSISDGEDNVVLWHCHAGCSQDAVYEAMLRVGAVKQHKVSEYSGDIAFPPDYPNPRQHIYRDQNGTPVFVVDRLPDPDGGKTFRQHGLDSHNSHNMDGVTRLPYQLHHWHSHESIIVVEGEQGVEALNRAGYPATCTPGGAGNWQQELKEHFAGKHVILIPDNDDPGRKHMASVAEKLTGIAASITTADICKNLNDKDDIVQWIQRNDIRTLISQIRPNDPARESLAAWLKKEMPPRDYLMGTVMCTTSRWMIYAPTGLGKTLFALNMATAIAAGKDFLNWKGGRPCRVLYIDGEMPRETFKERTQQVANLYGENAQVFGLNRDSLQADGEDIPPLNNDEGQAWLERQIDLYQPNVIIFDSIMCLLSGDMKEEESWEPVKKLMKSLTNRYIAQIWVHHTGHAEGRSYGSNTREWELDTVLRLDRPKDNGEGFVLNFTKHRLRTHINAEEFMPIQCALTQDGWHISGVTKETSKKGDDRANYRDAIVEAYDNLAVNVARRPVGHNGADVASISMTDIRAWCVRNGIMPPKDDGADVVSAGTRKVVDRAKIDLIKGSKFAGNSESIWRI